MNSKKLTAIVTSVVLALTLKGCLEIRDTQALLAKSQSEVIKLEQQVFALENHNDVLEVQIEGMLKEQEDMVKDYKELSNSLPEIVGVMEMESTAYTHTGQATRSGVMPTVGATIAVDPRVIPLGTKVYVEGYGFATAEDTGGAIKGDIIDVFLNTEAECVKWGRKYGVKVYILK